MKILIANDDGIDSPGILALSNAVSSLGDVTVVVPYRERSTSGHSLTLHKPLRIEEVRKNWYTTSGSPADCIYLGIHHILGRIPDAILAGINRGANLGTDIHYSGTVAAAREGALMNIKSYAFSLVNLDQTLSDHPKEPLRYEVAGRVAQRIIELTANSEFPSHTLLNVNIPNLSRERLRGARVTRQGFRYYGKEVVRRVDPRGRDYYWIGGAYLGFEESEVSDCHSVNEGWVTLTPLTIDCTHNDFYTSLKKRLSVEEL